MTPDTLAPPFFLAAGLLVIAGAVKAIAPDATAQALIDAGLPGSRSGARAIGAVEVSVGLWATFAAATGGAMACGTLYLLFAGFLLYVLLAHPDAGSCGCAGPTPVPPSRLHAALTLLAAAVGVAYAVTVAPSAPTWLSSLGWVAVPIVLGLALAGWLAIVAVTAGPGAFRSWTPPDHDHDREPHGHDHAVTDRELAAAGVMPGHTSLWPGTKP